MQTATLGRTGFNVSVAGLGCGGPSRLGTREGYGGSSDDAVRLVRTAIDAGVNLIDTAIAYGTEEVVGQAVRESGRRDELFITTKCGVNRTAAEFGSAIDQSLMRLGVDYIDAYFLHGIVRDELPKAMDEIVPVLLDARDAGKIRFLAVSEQFENDPAHEMFRDLYANEAWAEVFDVTMVGFNLLNPSARRYVFPHTQRLNVGTLCMFAVRRALSKPVRRAEVLAEMNLPGNAVDFLGDDEAVTGAGYRFCRHEPGVDCVLFGTGNVDHLRTNVESINAGPLAEDDANLLNDLFGERESVSGS